MSEPEDCTETQVREQAKPMPVMEFEGSFVTEMQAKLPAMSIALEDGYQRGVHMRLHVEVRVKSVHLVENRQGDLTRVHVLAMESAQIVEAFNPEEAADTSVTGSASAHPVPSEEIAEELGVQFGRTSDLWVR